VYVADTLYHQNWLEVRELNYLFSKILKPYFDVAKGSKKQKKDPLAKIVREKHSF
jgi:hypothetical protein